MASLSVIVIATNEERDLPRCLRSVSFADSGRLTVCRPMRVAWGVSSGRQPKVCR